MARDYRYRVVDVFTETALEGNALAVFPDASGLDGGTMQKIARELNLSETTFVLPPSLADCAANVRIFTPTKEMIFAGHPTVGTAFVLADEGRVPAGCTRFSLEEKVGAVPVQRDERGRFWLTTPAIKDGPSFDPSLCAEVLGLAPADLLDLPPQLLSAGNPTLFVALRDKGVVDRASLDMSGARKLRAEQQGFCVFVFTPTAEGAYSRMFAPELGMVEDPATGSSTGPLAVYMMRHGLAARGAGTQFHSEQGTRMGRKSILYVHVRGEAGCDGIDVGGYVTPLADCVMRL
jgi:trans-2,3-dihydro-3-hydroxyanthranilate isomerase